MAQRLKSWESPRRQGRNDKGRGGSARKRQLKKQQQMLRLKLKNPPDCSKKDQKNQNQQQKEGKSIPSFLLLKLILDGQQNYFLKFSAPEITLTD